VRWPGRSLKRYNHAVIGEALCIMARLGNHCCHAAPSGGVAGHGRAVRRGSPGRAGSGRPAKAPPHHRRSPKNPRETHRIPIGYPSDTHRIPKGYPRDTQGMHTVAIPEQHAENWLAPRELAGCWGVASALMQSRVGAKTQSSNRLPNPSRELLFLGRDCCPLCAPAALRLRVKPAFPDQSMVQSERESFSFTNTPLPAAMG
jgi:hypothetical protein